VPPSPQRTRTYAFLQALLSLGGFVVCGLGAAGALLLGLFKALSGAGLGSALAEYVGIAWIFGVLALLAVPAFWFALGKILGRGDPAPSQRGFTAASSALLLWPVLLVIGALLSGTDGMLASYLLPVLTTLATAVPIWWLLELTRRGLGSFSPRRTWGALNFALFFSNPAVMVAELLLIVALTIVAIVGLRLNPAAAAQVEQISQAVLQSNGDMEQIQSLLLPLLANPWAILAALSFFSVLVPLLEELFKPLAIWALLGLNASPADGFVLGAVAGAAFGLTETLFNLSNVAVQSQWLALVVGRTGTNLLHITTTALMGWGLVSAWRNAKFLRLGLAYAAAVSLHGLWNGFSVVAALAQLALPQQAWVRVLPFVSLAGMVCLAMVCLGALFAANRRLRPSTASALLETSSL
jgi:hypothetical protein